jgi:pimeloyl-ACP methyl ester carboxylesterase
MADDYSMWPLGRYLKRLGYQVYYAELGRNKGHVSKYVAQLGERIEILSNQANGQAFTLIGWSLGGVIVREAARLFPSMVSEVITMGTPIIGGPKFTSISKYYSKLKTLDLERFEQAIHQRNAIGLKQAITSIYSKTDGVVGWQASIDVYNPQAKNIEVNSSHLGLGVHPQVWKVIADTLAESD